MPSAAWSTLYRLHRRVGVLVVVLAATHALFLTLHAGGSALDLDLPAAGWSIFTGVIALACCSDSWSRPSWRASATRRSSSSSRLLGASFILGALHTFAVRGTAAYSPTLTIYWPALTAAGIASLAYRLVGGRLGIGRHRYRVDRAPPA